MDHSANTRSARLPSLIGMLVLCVALAACAKQPRPKCNVARGNFSATYTLISGKGACAELTGEVLGVQAYNARTSARDETPDYNRTSIGIQPQSITDMLASGATASNAKDKPYALGKLSTSDPDSDGFCVAPKLSVSRLRSPEIPEHSDGCTTTPAQPAVDVEYAWSNVRVYATAAALGTQLSATLNYAKDGCTAKYHVRAVYPSVSCAGTPPAPTASDDGDGGGSMSAADAPATPTEEDAGGGDAGAGCPPVEPPGPAPEADATLCSPEADPKQGRPVGSGLSPDFDIRCDPDLLLCVLKKDPPSLR